MLKIIVLCLIIGLVKVHASYFLPAGSLHYIYEPTVVGHTITHLPTAVSHQSQTIVHEKRPYLKPIVDYQPAAAFVRAHHAPSYTKILAAAPPHYAPLTYASQLHPTGWNTGLIYTNGWNTYPLK